jgi:hypothetical protein
MRTASGASRAGTPVRVRGGPSSGAKSWPSMPTSIATSRFLHARAAGRRVGATMRHRLSFANVVSCLALFVALGGTSYAVIKLPRNSVGSREVKDRSLTATDLAESARVRGPRGAQGPAGPAGERGPSNIVTANRNVVPMALNGPSSVDVVTLNLPAGSWMVVGTASVVFFGPGSDHFRCSLVFGAEDGSSHSVARIGNDAGSTDAALLAVQEGRALAAGEPVRLRCGHDSTLGGGTPRVDHAQITATRTDGLDIQPG